MEQGYKQSPLSPIPEDWEVKRLGEVGSFSKGSGVPKDKIISEGHPCLTYGDLYTKYDFVIKDIKSFIDEETSKESKEINAGDICFAGSGETPEDIGKCAAYLENCPAYAGGDIVILSPNNNINSLWLSYLLNSDIGGKQRYKFAQGFSIVHIYPDNLKQIQIPVPPLPEQQRIVSVLSLWDTAIAKQTALIENLTLRKRGLMQQLLTGKKRLKGFSGEWKEVRLGEIGKFVGGCAFNEQEQGGQTGIPFYKVSDMNLPGNESKMNIANNYVTHEQIERLGYIVIENEAIIFAKVGAAIALERKRYAKNFIIDNNMLAYLPNNNVWYMKYWFDSISLSKYIQVGALPSYNASDLSIIKLKMPSLKEQNAIASVLVNADKEIEIQKQKLAAMQAQKKGLMQVLLSGKRRVK